MSARLELYKYTGKDGDFGTHVESLGLKRIDSCVPSVYSDEHLNGDTKPSDDASDSATYCIYRPDDPECKAYSFECVFKLVLKDPPDVQLSNVRLYPVGPRPAEPDTARLYIGNSVDYHQPTNTKSVIAVDDIWNYSKEHPFYLTVAGNSGQMLDYRLTTTSYNVEWKDYGYGNVMVMNGVRQPMIPIPNKQDGNPVRVTFFNHTFMPTEADFIRFVDPSTGIDLTNDPEFVVDRGVAENNVQYVTISVDVKFMLAHPNGIVYHIPNFPPTTGYFISWALLPSQAEPGGKVTDKLIETVDVQVKCGPHGHPEYYLNGARKPMLTLAPGVIYHFINHDGSRFPMRFIKDCRIPNAADVNNIAVDGVTVLNGGTDQEEIFVDPEITLKHGACINAYEAVCELNVGNSVFVHPICMVGNYNICRPMGSIYNPMLAGETDYVYLQLEIDGKTKPGYCVPDIKIEYDEN